LPPVIRIENLSKAYQLGEIGTGTISRDLERWWAKARGKEDPFLRIGEANDRETKGQSSVVWSLKELNFEINQGDAVGIIGRNGAGKSTLLKILSRVTAPTTGSVKVKGRIASLLEVGTGFHPALTGRENIYLNGAILGMRKKEIARKFDEIVDFSGVERYIDTPVKRYSSGMYVRLAFAVAAHLESEILIVDEVLAVGDAEFQKKCLGKMGEVSTGEGRTVLFVSHNMGAVAGLCKSGILMERGTGKYYQHISEAIQEYARGNISHTQQPLINRTNRQGYGGFLIEDLEISHAETLNSLSITISYQVTQQDFNIKEFGLSIWSIDDKKIISISSDFMGGVPSLEPNCRKVTCIINELPLIEGLYQVNAFIGSERGLEDYVVGALSFSIDRSNYYGHGKTVDPNWGQIAVKHYWNYNG
jgi:lipopolysaccharide transport system ATP-binding protein